MPKGPFRHFYRCAISVYQLVSEAKKFTSVAKKPFDVLIASGRPSQGVISVRFLPMMLTPSYQWADTRK